jgi:hypothetical protein
MTKPAKITLVGASVILGALLVLTLSNASVRDEEMVEAAHRVRTSADLVEFDRKYPPDAVASHHSGYTQRFYYTLLPLVAQRVIEFSHPKGKDPWEASSEIRWFNRGL